MYKRVVYCKQFVFLANHPTDHALLGIIDLIQHAIDRQEFSCGIFLDFSKANDKDWFTSYLTNRYQYVSLGRTESELQYVSCGVPQGSVLAPGGGGGT